MKSTGRASDNLNSIVYLSRALISPTALNRMLRGMLMALRRLGNPVESSLYVVSGQLGAVAELHALAQEEGVGLAVLGDLPAVRQIGNDGFAAVARVAADQVVEHASHCSEIEDSAGLVEVEMRRPHRDAHADDATMLGVELGRFKLKFGAVEFQGYVGRGGAAPAHRIDPCRDGRAAPQKVAPVPPRSWGHEGRSSDAPLFAVLNEAC